MNAYTILYALNGVRGGYIQEAAPAPEGIRRLRRPLRILLAASAIAALLLGTALALSHGLRAALGDALGSFLPYVRPVEEEGVTDQGIRIKPVAALSDGNAVQVYFAVTDLTGDRLDENTSITPNVYPPNDGEGSWISWVTGRLSLLDYDSEARTGLYMLRIVGNGEPEENLVLPVQFREIHPGTHSFNLPLRPEWIAEDTLQTQTVSGKEVLTPGQTPRDLGSDLVSMSGFGFGADGVLHCQLRMDAPAVEWDESVFTLGIHSLSANTDPDLGYERTAWYKQYETYSTGALPEPLTRFEQDGVTYWDYRTGITPADLGDVSFFTEDGIGLRLQTKPTITGTWEMEIPTADVEKQSVDMLPTGTVLEGVTARTLHLSTIGCTLVSDPGGGPGTIGYALTVYLTDGTTVSAGEADSLFHAERHAANHWSFPEPVEVEAITGVAFGQWYVPLDNGVAGRGHWLETAP